MPEAYITGQACDIHNRYLLESSRIIPAISYCHCKTHCFTTPSHFTYTTAHLSRVPGILEVSQHVCCLALFGLSTLRMCCAFTGVALPRELC